MKEKVHILHINNNVGAGGQQQVFMDIIRSIDKEKFQVDLAVYDDQGIYRDEILALGCNIYVIPSITKHFIRHIKTLRKIIKDGHYDIIHQHASDSGILCNVIIAKWCKVKKIIVHSHCSYSKHLFLHKLLKPILAKCNTTQIACSKSAGKWMFQTDFQVISNAIDLDKFTFNKDEREKLRKQLNITSDTIVLGHVGRLDPVKNHKFLFRVLKIYMKKHKNTKLVLIGSGKLLEELKDYANQLKISDNVLFLGNQKDVYKFYNIFDVFLFPSHHEGQGICVLEALANGLFCLSNETLPIIQETYRLPLEEEVWCEKIEQVSLKRKKYDLSEYSYSKFIKKIEKIYEVIS